MSAALEITNNTGSDIMFTSIGQVNDDATWSAPKTGDKVPTGKKATIAMGNSSVFFAPKGVGADVKFICQGNFEMGQIYFDDPAVGAHSFEFDQTGKFNYAVSNPGGNQYNVAITLK